MSSLAHAFPPSWSEVLLGEVCDMVTGPHVPRESVGDVPVVKPRNVGDGRLTGEPDGITEEVAAALSPYRLAGGDVVFVRTGNLGRHALATSEHETWLFGTGLIRMRPGESIPATSTTT